VVSLEYAQYTTQCYSSTLQGSSHNLSSSIVSYGKNITGTYHIVLHELIYIEFSVCFYLSSIYVYLNSLVSLNCGKGNKILIILIWRLSKLCRSMLWLESYRYSKSCADILDCQRCNHDKPFYRTFFINEIYKKYTDYRLQ